VNDPLTTSKSAREALARGLNALQADPSVPAHLVELAAPIAQAMGALHQLERSRELAPHADVALNHVRGALAQLQAQQTNHPAVTQALEAVATSLSLVHTLSRMANGPAPAQAAPPPQQAPQQAPPAQQPHGPNTAAMPQKAMPAAGPTGQHHAPPQHAPQHHAPPQHAPQHHAPPQHAPQHHAPPQQASGPHAAYPQQPAFPQAAPHAGPPPGAHAGPPPGPPPGMGGPQAMASGGMVARDPFAAPAGPPPGPPPGGGAPGGVAMPPPGGSPARASMPVPAPPAGNLQVIPADLGAHSATNFYKGLSGNDIIDHGGLFVSTYVQPKIGTPVRLKVSLPGGYEFEANAVVKWTREDAGGDAPPGFGAQFTAITPEARQLVYRYVRNREPLFHDDF